MGRISNGLKNQTEQKAKQAMKKIMAKIAPFLIKGLLILVAACLLLGIFNAVVSKLAELISKIGDFATSVWVWITDDYWIDIDQNITLTQEDGTEKTQTLVEHYMEQMESLGISLEDLRLLGEVDYSNPELLDSPENKIAMEKYFHEFVRADIISQEIHRRRGNALVNSSNENEVDGGVYLYRTKDNLEQNASVGLLSGGDGVLKMEYEDPEDFEAYAAKEDKDYDKARKMFTIDPQTKELLYYEVDQIEEGGYECWNPDASNDNTPGVYTNTLRVQRVDYRSYIQKYAMPFEFLLNLCMITQNPEFVYHVAYLARNTHIELMILDSIEEENSEEEVIGNYYEYQYDGQSIFTDESGEYLLERKTKYIRTDKTTFVVGKVNTWSYSMQNTYINQVEGTEGQTTNTYSVGDKSVEIEDTNTDGEKKTIVMTNRVKTSTALSSKTNEFQPGISVDETKKTKQFLGLLRNETGKCYDEDSIKNCVENSVFKKDGYNVTYRIPNSTEEEMPLSKLQSGEQMLYQLLEIQNTNNEGSNSYNAKMQGLKEYIQYVLTFPPNEDGTTNIEDNNVDDLLNGGGNTNDNPTYGIFGWPLSQNISYKITSYFGVRRAPTSGASTNHGAIDIGGIGVGANILAAEDGIVEFSGGNSTRGYGYNIIINHQNGYKTRYAHNSELLVSTGDFVRRGQLIAKSGSTGVSTGPHLHFEVILNGTKVDPLDYVSANR